jgi:hypothetical protein
MGAAPEDRSRLQKPGCPGQSKLSKRDLSSRPDLCYSCAVCNELGASWNPAEVHHHNGEKPHVFHADCLDQEWNRMRRYTPASNPLPCPKCLQPVAQIVLSNLKVDHRLQVAHRAHVPPGKLLINRAFTKAAYEKNKERMATFIEREGIALDTYECAFKAAAYRNEMDMAQYLLECPRPSRLTLSQKCLKEAFLLAIPRGSKELLLWLKNRLPADNPTLKGFFDQALSTAVSHQRKDVVAWLFDFHIPTIEAFDNIVNHVVRDKDRKNLLERAFLAGITLDDRFVKTVIGCAQAHRIFLDRNLMHPALVKYAAHRKYDMIQPLLNHGRNAFSSLDYQQLLLQCIYNDNDYGIAKRYFDTLPLNRVGCSEKGITHIINTHPYKHYNAFLDLFLPHTSPAFQKTAFKRCAEVGNVIVARKIKWREAIDEDTLAEALAIAKKYHQEKFIEGFKYDQGILYRLWTDPWGTLFSGD